LFNHQRIVVPYLENPLDQVTAFPGAGGVVCFVLLLQRLTEGWTLIRI
jgi:hypothetical protein